jgi:DNA-binding transcriptional ArsR family regulator
MEPEKLQPLFDFCKVLLDEDRLRIVGVLARQPARVKELAETLEIKEPLAARHLARLVEAELVRQEEPGLYRLDLGRLLALKKLFFSLPQPARDDESEAEKILRRFVKEEQLVQIPKDRGKLLLV